MANQRSRSATSTKVIYLTLEEMFNGTERKLALHNKIVCKKCRGSGSAYRNPQFMPCCQCGGVGYTAAMNSNNAPIYDTCDFCEGAGTTIAQQHLCSKCSGKKFVSDKYPLNVIVRKGSRHNQKIIFKSAGSQELHKKPGDVIVFLNQIEHPVFERIGDDLQMEVNLTLTEALCGFTTTVEGVDKEKITLSRPPGAVVDVNIEECVYGKGMPLFAHPERRGNLLIKYIVNAPDRIPTKFIGTIRQCLPTSEPTEIPINAKECNLVDMEPEYQDEDYDDGAWGHSHHESQEQFDYSYHQYYEHEYDEQQSGEYDQHYHNEQYNYHQQQDDSLESHDGSQQ